MLRHECCGETLELHADRAVFWPRGKMMIVADVHLGKAAAFRSGGIPIPRGTTGKNLSRLSTLIDGVRPERLLVLGDLVHARAGYTPELIASVAHWRASHAALQWLVVAGNHDRHAGDFPDAWNISLPTLELCEGPFRFRHMPDDDAATYTLAGHVHPCVELNDGVGSRLRAPCFWFGPRCGVLPAFGSFTGMHPIAPQAGDALFVASDIVQAVPTATFGRRIGNETP